MAVRGGGQIVNVSSGAGKHDPPVPADQGAWGYAYGASKAALARLSPSDARVAERGHRVLMVEKKRFPREKTCGDGLTPRSVRQLTDMGLAEPLSEFHRYDGLRSIAHGVTMELKWPDHPEFPDHGYVVRRRDLDEMVAQRAVKAGATLWQACEALEPVVEGGIVTGAMVKHKETGTTERVSARYLVVADGSNSRFGRALGTSRDRTYPLGMAVRGYYRSPLSEDPWIESHLDIVDRDGAHLPGYGWIFPLGDGRVNVGVGLLSTFAGWKDINTSRLMDTFVDVAPNYWGLSPEGAEGPVTGGKLPTGGTWAELISAYCNRLREVAEKKGTPASPATARARSVLPVPGGPTRSTPLGIRPPSNWNFLGFLRNSTTS